MDEPKRNDVDLYAEGLSWGTTASDCTDESIRKRARADVRMKQEKSDFEKSPYPKSSKVQNHRKQERDVCKKALFQTEDDGNVFVISDDERPEMNEAETEKPDTYAKKYCLRHSLGKLCIKQDECLYCGIESSVKSQTSQLEQKIKINRFVKNWGKKREQVPADGHCILHAFFLGLKESHFNQISSVQSLLPKIKTEILRNLDLYSPFVGDLDLVEELDNYLESRHYNSDVVDLMLHVLANITSTSVLVFYVSGDSDVQTLLVHPPSATPQRTIYLSRVGQHYDAILDVSTINSWRKKGKYSQVEPEDIQVGDPTKLPPVMTHNRYDALSSSLNEENDDCSNIDATRDDEDEVVIISVKPIKRETPLHTSNTGYKNEESESSDEGSHFDTSSDSSEPNVRICAGKTYLSQKLWKGIPAMEVDCIPHDIDGLKKYSLPFRAEKRMESTQDGRKWQRYVASKRSGFEGIRRVAQCKGSYRCDNTLCDFLKEYGRPNRHHFSQKGDKLICKHCHIPGLFVRCTARKIWEFDDEKERVTVLHYGNHSCIATSTRNTKAEKKIEEAFKKNPKLKVGQMSVNCVVEAIIEGKNWEEVDDLSKTLVDEQRTRNIKKKAVREGNPYGHCFEALGILKAKTDHKDKYLIHKINDRRLNGKPSFVFKTSVFKARMCISMDRNNDTVLSKEYCHFDGKVNRCPGFTTLTASVYHPTLRKMIKLAIMETEGEREELVSMFWEELDNVIKEVSGDPGLSFKPFGFMTDEAGGIWNSIKKTFPEEIVNNSVSCEFHFMQSVNRHTSHIAANSLKRRYKKIAKQLMDSATPTAYFETFNVMENFIDNQKQGKKELRNWLRWWDQRRIHRAKAFKCDLSAPQANLSESVNASYAHRGSCNITLLRAAYEDTADSILIENQWKQYQKGEKAGGTGPSSASRDAREVAKQKREAFRMVEELGLLDKATGSNNITGTEAVETAYKDCQIDPACSFEPTRTRKTKTGRPRKKNVSVYDTDSDSDSEHSDNNDESNNKRAARTRKKPSKEFEKSLEKAIKGQNRIKAQTLVYNPVTKYFEVTLKSQNTVIRGDGKKNIWNTYTCWIGTHPSCDCLYFVSNKGQICKHIVWTMINLFGESKNSTLLFQVSLTRSEIERVKEKVCSEIPPSIRFNDDQQASSQTHSVSTCPQQQEQSMQQSQSQAPQHQQQYESQSQAAQIQQQTYQTSQPISHNAPRQNASQQIHQQPQAPQQQQQYASQSQAAQIQQQTYQSQPISHNAPRHNASQQGHQLLQISQQQQQYASQLHSAQNQQNHQPSPHMSHCARQNASQQTIQLHQSQRPRPNVAPGSFELWLLNACDAKVSICYGCGNTLKVCGNIPEPPYNLVK